MLSSTELNKLVATCDSNKTTWDSVYYEANAYTQPERNEIFRTKGGNPGNLKQVRLFTQAGKTGTDIFVARIQNKLSPIGQAYFNFEPKKSLSSDYIQQLRDFGAGMSSRVNEIKESLGLDKTLHDAYYDLAAGTAVVMREDSLYGTQFKKLPFTQYKLGTEVHQTVCRSFEMPAYQIGITWPELANKQEIGGVRVDGATKYQEIKLNDVLYYNEPTRQYEYYLRYGSEILLTRIYKSSPYHIFHWGRIADMPYSAGVALKALPALKRLNSFIKANLELIPCQFPMFLTTAGNVLSKNLTFKPGGFLTVRDMQGFQPLTLGANRSDFKLELQTEEIAIKETFLDSTLPSVPRDMTAAEVNARITPYGETANVNVALLTDTLKGIGWDLFDDIFNREIAGTVNFTLEDMHDMLECNINNDATMDNNLIQKITGYINNISFDPQAIWQALDRNKTLERLGRAWNVPVEISRTADEITKAQQADAQAQAQAVQQAQNAQMQVDSNKEQSKAMAKLIEQQGNA